MERNATLSWQAIIAGGVAGVGANFLLNLLSFSIGVTVFTTTTQDILSFSIPCFSLFFISAVMAMFFTGWVAGFLSNTQKPRNWGMLYGFLAWCVSLIITILIITNAIQFATFHSNFTSRPNQVAIRITSQFPMQLEQPTIKNSKPAAAMNAELATKIISLNGFVTFILFLIGAISSCLGGYLGFGNFDHNLSRQHIQK